MMNFANIGIANTILPLAGLTAVALGLPRLTVPQETRSQGRLAIGMVLAAALTLAAALGLFAALYAMAGETPRMQALVQAAAMSALAWGPLWALAWLVRAQGLEKRRGQDMARRG